MKGCRIEVRQKVLYPFSSCFLKTQNILIASPPLEFQTHEEGVVGGEEQLGEGGFEQKQYRGNQLNNFFPTAAQFKMAAL